MRWAPLICLLLLAGCASSQPAVPPVPVLCQVPAGMRGPLQQPPPIPEGSYTQRDVALYIVALHHWGTTGWELVAAIDEWIQNNCG